LAAVLLLVASLSARSADLEEGFAHPPDSARPHTWWHWMGGNITREGITADLEAMKSIGLGGAQIFNVDINIPPGPVKFMGPEWRELFKHAVTEADRLGLKLSVNNCAGWANSGGPWNTPENAMQRVVTGEVPIKGPARFDAILPQPPTNLGYYRDIAVLAFLAPAGESAPISPVPPKVSASVPGDPSVLLDGRPETALTFPAPSPDSPQFAQLEFAAPVAARSVRIYPGPGMRNSGGEIQVSDDGVVFRPVRPFEFGVQYGKYITVLLGESPVEARFWRIVFNRATDSHPRPILGDIELSARFGIENLDEKTGFNGRGVPAGQVFSARPDEVIPREGVVDLTDKLASDGHLVWDVPAGDWVILRVGHTPSGETNHPAPKEGLGPECDKLDPAALDAHWAGFMQKIIDDAGPLAGKSLDGALIDSYEVGGQNWTGKFREEFRARRGYDLQPFFPVFTGRVVGSPEITERFLSDLRLTIADLFAENYFGHFAELCRQNKLLASIEPYTGPFEPFQCGKPADIVMGEFWSGAKGHPSVKVASSIAHIYGKTLVGAESFTASPEAGRWQNDPASLKMLGDAMFCKGVNRYIFHRYAMQPWLNRWPGMTMGPYGFNFERTVTWWDPGSAWIQYVSRCQFLLQQGRSVADVALFCGENTLQLPAIDPGLPSGYDYDRINADVLLNHASVKDGRLVLDSGMSYRVLVLSLPDRAMTPGLLRKLRDLAADGLAIAGPPPEKAPGLSGYPESDAEVKNLVAGIWGGTGGKNRVFPDQPMARVFAALGVKPDFEFPSDGGSQLAFIHRLAGDADIYFVSNQSDRFDSTEGTFRVVGKVPEFWYPDTGLIARAPVWREEDGRTVVPLQFDPAGSVFVIFRKGQAVADHVVAAAFSSPGTSSRKTSLPVLQRARYESVDSDRGADVTALLAGMARGGTSKAVVNNKTLGVDPAPMHRKQLRLEYALDGRVMEKIVPENDSIEIGGLSAPNEPPALRLAVGADGAVKFIASAPGVAELKTASGKTLKVEARDVPEPVDVTGPWELDFPPNWGAPAKVDLPRLISWTEHADSGVKYFSGTATYIKEVEISAGMFGGGNSLWLDLGSVKNLAEISVNGKPVGILWKPPFRADITGAAKPGKNRLEIKITNLWPNRLIGDEQLPPDCEWGANNAIKVWPQWLLEGKPSPTGRFTFTTWHLWKKDDKPLPSGMLGPVTIISEVKIPINR